MDEYVAPRLVKKEILDCRCMRYVYDDGIVEILHCRKHSRFIKAHAGKACAYMLCEDLTKQKPYVPRNKLIHNQFVVFFLMFISTVFVGWNLAPKKQVDFPSVVDIPPNMRMANPSNPFGLSVFQKSPLEASHQWSILTSSPSWSTLTIQKHSYWMDSTQPLLVSPRNQEVQY